MIELSVRGIGLLGPGLADWTSGAAVLRAPAGWRRSATVVPAPSRLPANERRRAGTVVKAALAVADQAVAMADADPAQLATVFTSSTGDPANCHALCEALAAPDPAARLVSPTRFTNSVHNAAAGYWHIATHSMRASTSLAVYDASFGAGLLEAAVWCHVKGEEVLLVACDVPYPEPLHTLRPIADTMAVALVLAPLRAHGGHRGACTLRLQTLPEPAASTRCTDAALEVLRGEIPAARALPLLVGIAMAPRHAAAPALLHLDVAEGCTLAIEVACPP
ncbi:MAG: beta-ketoacyl synthase chain length factor [Burkholderiales bacterium]|nr:beta-ketoacyl synthase chain length factor [Burkholderiales bacterium]